MIFKMKNQFRKVLVGLVFVSLSFISVQAQIPEQMLGDAKYGVDTAARKECLSHLTMYREYYKQRNYTDALKAWRIVYDICPKASKRIFVDGASMYKYQAKKERDPNVKRLYIDTLMNIYTKRIANFNEKGKVLGFKGKDLITLDPEAVQKANEILAEGMTLSKTKTNAQVIYYRFMTAEQMFQEGNYEGGDLISLYAESIEIMEAQLEKAQEKKKKRQIKNLTTSLANLEKLFTESGVASSENLEQIFQPKYDENPTDVKLLKKIIKLLTGTEEGTESKLYASAVESLYPLEPSADAAAGIAKLFTQKGDYDKAIEYYTNAISLETDVNKKSEFNVTLGNIYNSFKLKPVKAREYARKAIAQNPNNGEAYILIGLIYASVTDYGANPVEKNSVYWLAVDYFAKAKKVDSSVAAKANDYIKKYKGYYPIGKDIFFHLPDANEGDKFKIGSWINETTTVRVGK